MRGRTRPPCIKTGGPETAYLCRGGTGTHTGRNNERKDTRTPLHAQTCQEHLFQFKSSGIINRRAPRRRDVRRINTHTHTHTPHKFVMSGGVHPPRGLAVIIGLLFISLQTDDDESASFYGHFVFVRVQKNAFWALTHFY